MKHGSPIWNWIPLYSDEQQDQFQTRTLKCLFLQISVQIGGKLVRLKEDSFSILIKQDACKNNKKTRGAVNVHGLSIRRIRNHSILWDTLLNPFWSQIVSLVYSCVIRNISIVLKATKFSQITMPNKQTRNSTKDARVQLYLLCEFLKKRLHLQNKRSVTDDVVTIKLQRFILITVPHINVVTGKGHLKQSQHRLTMS